MLLPSKPISTDSGKVSVVIPTYNREAALPRAIDSVLQQTYPIHEIIVVDDASDLSVQTSLKDKYGETYDRRIRVIRNTTNLGGGESRNIGVEKAAGDFVAFLDSDDSWLPNKIEKQMRVFQTHPDVGLVYCNLLRIDKDANLVESNRELLDRDIWQHLLDGWMTFPNTSNLLFKKDTFVKLGGFDPELASCQDHDLWMRVGLKGIRVEYVSDGLTVVTKDAGNRVSTDYGRRMDGVFRFLSKWEEYIAMHKGEKHFRGFRSRYLVTAAFDIFATRIRNLEVLGAMKIYLSLFIANPEFYRRLLQRLKQVFPFWERPNSAGLQP